MRLAFIAAAARVECPPSPSRPSRRRNHNRRPLLSSSSTIITRRRQQRRRRTAAKIVDWIKRIYQLIFFSESFAGSSISTHHRRFRRVRIATSDDSQRPRPSSTAPTSSHHRSSSSSWLAVWHLLSLILFLHSSFVLVNALDSSSSSSMDEDWTRQSSPPSSYIVEDTNNNFDDDPNSCHRYDYYFSSSSSSSSDSSSPSPIVRRSVDSVIGSGSPSNPSSPFNRNPDMDNVFAVWLRAARYNGRTIVEEHLQAPSAEDDDAETSWPLQRPRARHRYQHYRNAVRASTRRWPPPFSSSTSSPRSAADRRRPTTSSSRTPVRSVPRISAVLSPSSPAVDSSSTSSPTYDRRKTPTISGGGTQPSPKPPVAKPSSSNAQCKMFDEGCAVELCSLDIGRRVQELRNVYLKTNMAQRDLFWNDTISGNNNYSILNSSNNTNLTLYEFFALDVRTDWQQRRPSVSHLADWIRPCIISDPTRSSSSSNTNSSSGKFLINAQQKQHQQPKETQTCRTCYRKVLSRLKKIDSSHEAFSQSVLSMIDCEPDNDLERFSPTSNCSQCKLWYKRWLLVIFSDMWKQKPCLQWCHLAELACPHLTPVRNRDYAGLPSFRCTDPEIPYLQTANSTYGPPCDCVHPCDMDGFTKHWRWNISGDAEMKEFCRDYLKRDRDGCQQKKTSTSSSTSTSDRKSASSKSAASSSASSSSSKNRSKSPTSSTATSGRTTTKSPKSKSKLKNGADYIRTRNLLFFLILILLLVFKKFPN